MDKELTRKELTKLGFNYNSKGFIYWVELLTNEDIKLVIKMNKDCVTAIYGYIADLYNTTASSVERDMRYCLNPAKDNLKKKYNWAGKISTRTFIYLKLMGVK